MGLHVVQAEEITPPQATESTQIKLQPDSAQFEQSKEQNDSTDEEIGQITPEVDQDQTTDSKVEAVQNIEGTDDDVDQDQTANNKVCQDQVVQATVACHDQVESDVDGQIGQGQTTNLTIEQEQSEESLGGIEAVQKLKAGIDSEQTQSVILPGNEIDTLQQKTDATTDQTQTVISENAADVKFQQDTDITVVQLQDFDASGEKADEQEQLTVIDANQKLKVESSGSALLEQAQYVVIDGSLVNTFKEVVQVGVTVTTQNYLEVVKDATGELVKFVQKIFVNDQLIDNSERETDLEVKNVHGAFQSYEKEFDWGTVIVKNVAMLFLNDEKTDYKAFLKSSISLVFGAELFGTPVAKPNDDPPPGGDDQGEPTIPPDDNNDEEPATPPGDNGEEPTTPPNEESEENPTAPTQEENNSTSPTPKLETATVVKEVANAELVKAAPKSESQVNELPNTASNHHNLLLGGIALVAAGSILLFRKSKKFTI